MSNQDRLAQLRVLVNRLEAMPPSADRDWMLAEVRSRAVDLDTGIAPRPMRPLESGMTLEPPSPAPAPATIVAKRVAKAVPATPAAAPARRPAPAPAAPVTRRPAHAPAPAARRPAPAPVSPPRVVNPPSWEATFPASVNRDDHVDLLALDGLLSLGDESPATEPTTDAKARRPWAGGLRG